MEKHDRTQFADHRPDSNTTTRRQCPRPPVRPQPHDPDVKALLRIAVVWNIPAACNRASADYMISSPLLTSEYERQLPEYDDYQNRMVKVRAAADAVVPAAAA